MRTQGYDSTIVQQMVLGVEAELKGRKIPVSDLTTEAGISPSTWSRWKAGSNSPTLQAWTQALEAKARLVQRGKAAVKSKRKNGKET